jgi:glycosyltransferase involved in cell wall biosynthesis
MQDKISIVIPVYNSETIVSKTVDEILKETKKENLNIEILLINDGSPDNSWNIIKNLAKEIQEVKSINLIKNFGQHNAVLCGFENATGDYVITMDDDLQNPPSEIIHIVNKITENEDTDLVFGKFREKKHAGYRKLGSRLIGYLNEKVFNKPKNITLTNFRIAKKDVIDRVLKHNTAYPYIPGLLLMYSTKIENVMVEHHDRFDGKSNYTFTKIFSLISNLLINYSSYPLKVLSTIGIVVSSLSFFIGLFFLISGFIGGVKVAGWTTLVVLVSFLGGFIIILLGLIGEYLSRILDQMSNNKSYYVKEIVDE